MSLAPPPNPARRRSRPFSEWLVQGIHRRPPSPFNALPPSSSGRAVHRDDSQPGIPRRRTDFSSVGKARGFPYEKKAGRLSVKMKDSANIMSMMSDRDWGRYEIRGELL